MKWKCESDSKRDRELYQKQKLHEKFDDQLKRSKREDLDKLQSDWDNLRSDWEKLGCGALNTDENQ